MLLTSCCFGMNLPEPEYVTINIGNNAVISDEYFCEIAMKIYHKKTSFECSPELKPYILRTLDHSIHNGDSQKFASMVRELNKEDEDFLMMQVNKAVALALKDQKHQINERITKKNAALWVAVGGFICTAITTAATLGSTLSGDCPK